MQEEHYLTTQPCSQSPCLQPHFCLALFLLAWPAPARSQSPGPWESSTLPAGMVTTRDIFIPRRGVFTVEYAIQEGKEMKISILSQEGPASKLVMNVMTR